MKLGATFLVMGGVQLVAVALGGLTGNWGWFDLGALGPIAVSLYLVFIKPPEGYRQPLAHDPQGWVPQSDS